MGKKQQKSKQHNGPVQQNILMLEAFDYQKFAEAMVNAQLKAKEKEDGVNAQKNNADIEKWQKMLGYKEYADNEKWYLKWFHNLKNFVGVFLHLLFLKKENATFDFATLVLLQLFLNAVFGVIKWTLYILAGFLTFLTVYSPEKGIFAFNALPLIYSCLLFVLARLVRIAQFEIENMEERGYLIGMLSAVASFVAMVIALFALLK